MLVGGASMRFGRNKLLEPLANGDLLVDRPVAALRAVFGGRVAMVGLCDERVGARGDLVIPDRWPRMGPAGGVASALAHFAWDVFVLAGDLPAICESVVRLVVDTAHANPDAAAVLARVACPEPCVGIYRIRALAPLEASLRAGGSTSVVRRLEGLTIATVTVSAETVVNANTPEQLLAADALPLARGAT